MITLESLSKNIADKKWPPVDEWNPDFCGDLDLVIKKNGEWFYHGTIINRKEMVTLFASVLKHEGDDYFLVTPVEKVKITVENTPFLVVKADLIEGSWVFTSNLDDQVLLGERHPLYFSECGQPQIVWRRNLPARINQNVFYQLQVHALEHNTEADGKAWLSSQGKRFSIGSLD